MEQAGGGVEGMLDVRAMGDDSIVVVDKEEGGANSAWPPWKHLLEDIAATRPTPTNLKLGYKNLGDAGAFRLAELLQGKLSTLTSLDLTCTSIGSGGAVAIARSLGSNVHLVSLDMSSNAVSDAGCCAMAEALRSNSSLQSLSLHACLVGDKGAKELASALVVNKCLKEVNLRQNYVGDEGAVALADALAASPTLSILDLQSNSFRSTGRKALAKAYDANSRVQPAMPLSWHSGGASRPQQQPPPPRSLVSVDTSSGLQRKKPANATNLGIGPASGSFANSHGRSSGPLSPESNKRGTGEGDERGLKSPAHVLRSPSLRSPGTPSRGGADLHFAWGADAGTKGGSLFLKCWRFMAGVGRSRIALTRTALIVAIIVATGELVYLSSQMEDVDMSRLPHLPKQWRSRARGKGVIEGALGGDKGKGRSEEGVWGGSGSGDASKGRGGKEAEGGGTGDRNERQR